MSPEAAYLMEKSHLIALLPYIPPVYQTLYRTVDLEGYAAVDTNRHSVPERLIGEEEFPQESAKARKCYKNIIPQTPERISSHPLVRSVWFHQAVL